MFCKKYVWVEECRVVYKRFNAGPVIRFMDLSPDSEPIKSVRAFEGLERFALFTG